MKPKITIIGAGIAGLTTAVYLNKKGFEVQIIEATERAGGRIKTDIIDGFRLDRGFQVLLTEYPETKALLEGLPVSQHNDLAVGIAIHHLPIAIILTTFFINAGLNKTAIFVFMATFAVMTPLGTILSNQLNILNEYYSEITAVVIGILFHISTTIIFESSEGHKFNIAKVSMIMLGILIAYFI